MKNGNTDSSVLEAESKNDLRKQRGLFVAVPLEFLIESKNLSLPARWIYVLLWRFVAITDDGSTPGVFPSYDKLQEFSGLGRASVAKAIRELTAAGWIRKQRRFGKSTVYFLQKSIQ